MCFSFALIYDHMEDHIFSLCFRRHMFQEMCHEELHQKAPEDRLALEKRNQDAENGWRGKQMIMMQSFLRSGKLWQWEMELLESICPLICVCLFYRVSSYCKFPWLSAHNTSLPAMYFYFQMPKLQESSPLWITTCA